MENKEEIKYSWYRREDEDDGAFAKFDYYRRMAPSERNIVELCRQLGKHENSSHVRSIAKKYNWTERVRDWDNHVTAMRDKAMIEQATEVKIEYVEHARALRIALLKSLEEFYDRYKRNPAIFETMSDKELIRFIANLPDKLKRVQETEFTAYGHATEITKNDVDVKSNGKSFIIEFSDDVEDENDDD